MDIDNDKLKESVDSFNKNSDLLVQASTNVTVLMQILATETLKNRCLLMLLCEKAKIPQKTIDYEWNKIDEDVAQKIFLAGLATNKPI